MDAAAIVGLQTTFTFLSQLYADHVQVSVSCNCQHPTALYTVQALSSSTIIRFFTRTKLNENNFTSRMWWVLIEEIAPRAEETAGEKKVACVLEVTTYKRICAQQQLGKCWCVVAGVSSSEKFSM